MFVLLPYTFYFKILDTFHKIGTRIRYLIQLKVPATFLSRSSLVSNCSIYSLHPPFLRITFVLIFVSTVYFCIIPSKLGHLQNCFQLHVSHIMHIDVPLLICRPKSRLRFGAKKMHVTFFFFFLFYLFFLVHSNEKKTTRLSIRGKKNTHTLQPKKFT